MPGTDAAGNPTVIAVRDLPASERFFAGGDTTIRGYALDSVGAPETITSSGFPKGGDAEIVLNDAKLQEAATNFDVTETLRGLEEEMLTAANNLEFEKVALLRDQIRELKRALDGAQPGKPSSSGPSRQVSYRKTPRGRGARKQVPF